MMVSVGVDVSERRGLDVVALDAQRRLVAPPRHHVTPDVLVDILESLKPDVEVVTIDSPPGIGASGPSRDCELDLRARGINVFSTPSDPIRFARPFYNWVRVGQEAFHAAAEAGLPLFDNVSGVAGTAVEVFPHATDVFLRGHRPPPGVTRSAKRKKEWRSDTLRRAGLSQVDQLRSLDAVDAALAAVTGLHGLEGTFHALGLSPFFIIVPAPPGAVATEALRATRRNGATPSRAADATA